MLYIMIYMKVIKKLIIMGGCSKGIIIPHDYFEYHEHKTGKKITKVIVEMDEKITITPIFDDNKK